MDIHTRLSAPPGRPYVEGHTTYDPAVHELAGLEDIGVYVVALQMIDKQGWASAAELDGESRGLSTELVLESVRRLLDHGLLALLVEPEPLRDLPTWARAAADTYLVATADTRYLEERLAAAYASPTDAKAHSLQTLSETTAKLQRIRADLNAWQGHLEDLHDALSAAPEGEGVPEFLRLEAGRFASMVLRLHEGAATRLLDGPYGPAADSLRVRFDGTCLLTPSGAIPLAGLQLPAAEAPVTAR
ncbi:hypothetical protein [Kitasatospora sp. NPDC002965]|uniref:hypothetical protein n=1 Tax=Kitasatospora sp. NPDC002965 TaxID=3154775 RepID=UPI0033B879FE